MAARDGEDSMKRLKHQTISELADKLEKAPPGATVWTAEGDPVSESVSSYRGDYSQLARDAWP